MAWTRIVFELRVYLRPILLTWININMNYYWFLTFATTFGPSDRSHVLLRGLRIWSTEFHGLHPQVTTADKNIRKHSWRLPHRHRDPEVSSLILGGRLEIQVGWWGSMVQESSSWPTIIWRPRRKPTPLAREPHSHNHSHVGPRRRPPGPPALGGLTVISFCHFVAAYGTSGDIDNIRDIVEPTGHVWFLVLTIGFRSLTYRLKTWSIFSKPGY